MKKVTMFVWNNFVNDARVLREASALAELGYETTIIAKKELTEMNLASSEVVQKNIYVNRPLKLELPGFITKRISSSILTKHLPNMLLMLKMIMIGRGQKSDVYHAHDLNTLIQGIACAKLRLKRKLLIYDSHEVQTSRTHYSFDKIYKIEKFLLNFVDEVIVENDTRAEYHYNLYKQRPTSIHNYSELYNIDEVKGFPIKEKYNIDKEKKIVLYQGGMQEGRGLFKLLDAFKNIESAMLLMIGDGKERQNLIDYHHKLKLEDKVIFIDRVPYKDLRSYTKSADIGIQFLENVNFNHYSASSNKLFEYIMAHVPVIGSNLPEIERVIKEEEVGLIVEESNTRELQDAIQLLIDNEAVRKTCQKNTNIAKEKYNWNLEKKKFKKIYEKV